MKILVVAMSLFLLSSCSLCPTKTVIQEVKVEVPIKCQTPTPEIPIFPFDTIVGDENVYIVVRTALADIEIRKAYELKLSAALRSCK